MSRARDRRERPASEPGDQTFGFGFGTDDHDQQPAQEQQSYPAGFGGDHSWTPIPTAGRRRRRRRWPWFVGGAAGLVVVVLGVIGSLSDPAAPTALVTTAAASSSSSSSATPTTSPIPTPAPGTALAALDALPVKGRSARTGYDRAAFGTAWADVDGNGCDTRDDVLARDLTAITRDGACEVETGVLVSPYTAVSMQFVRGYTTSGEVQIDHIVALADAWRTGASTWTASEREAFANDPLNLFAVDGPSNQQKSDGDAATWLPANKSFRCAYVAHQVAVKAKYRLSVAPAEYQAIARVLAKCPAQDLPDESSKDVHAVTATSTAPPSDAQREAKAQSDATAKAAADAAAKAAADTAAAQAAADAAAQQAAADAAARQAAADGAAQAPAPAGGSTYYPNCSAVRAAGAAPIRTGDPGYSRKLDRDGDGVACE
ncbi:excalibur calcium-binding domain-containing protein [Curtobacterium sp. MCPF17_031]|uniref:excalibur calcium-binding domain-containing protein n=1 Tax=Curtobacterium sp. MCPF17_031 TaxID=2175653 RepID=UPI0021ACC44F|nr:excalibur calcium-binding domain-containing protein [Curtobacterium sp. MCPF17_031]